MSGTESPAQAGKPALLAVTSFRGAAAVLRLEDLLGLGVATIYGGGLVVAPGSVCLFCLLPDFLFGRVATVLGLESVLGLGIAACLSLSGRIRTPGSVCLLRLL